MSNVDTTARQLAKAALGGNFKGTTHMENLVVSGDTVLQDIQVLGNADIPATPYTEIGTEQLAAASIEFPVISFDKDSVEDIVLQLNLLSRTSALTYIVYANVDPSTKTGGQAIYRNSVNSTDIGAGYYGSATLYFNQSAFNAVYNTKISNFYIKSVSNNIPKDSVLAVLGR